MTFIEMKQFQVYPRFIACVSLNPRLASNLPHNLNRTKFYVMMDMVTSPAKEQGSTVNSKCAQLIPARFGSWNLQRALKTWTCQNMARLPCITRLMSTSGVATPALLTITYRLLLATASVLPTEWRCSYMPASDPNADTLVYQYIPSGGYTHNMALRNLRMYCK